MFELKGATCGQKLLAFTWPTYSDPVSFKDCRHGRLLTDTNNTFFNREVKTAAAVEAQKNEAAQRRHSRVGAFEHQLLHSCWLLTLFYSCEVPSSGL